MSGLSGGVRERELSFRENQDVVVKVDEILTEMVPQITRGSLKFGVKIQ